MAQPFLRAQPWIFSARFDLGFILAPALIVTLAALSWSLLGNPASETSPWVWLALVVGVDVAHVYSTLFRTYFDRAELSARPWLYGLTPLLAWLGGCLLYWCGSLIFWRVLAYAAVFHFVRQQYGFMMIYARRERGLPPFFRRIDKATIYGATLYPLVYWHCHQRQFSWFVEGDFIRLDLPLLAIVTGIAYCAILAAYVVKEAILLHRGICFNLPRNLLLVGTAGSWFIGIVLFDNDLLFTGTNIIAHGIPYIALIWGYGRNQARLQGRRSSFLARWIARLFTWRAVPVYVAILFGLAYLEEGLWDGFVWREHASLFGAFRALPSLGSSDALIWLAPLLAMPQATHYILDAVIWRLQTRDTNWKQVLFAQEPGRS